MSDFSLTITPRFYETDAQGHISNVTIAGWFEVARTALLGRVLADDMSSQVQWLLANVNIDYLAETHFGSDVTVTLEKLQVGNTSLTMSCVMTQQGRECVRGKAVLVNIDPHGRGKCTISDELRGQLRALFPQET
ncbi:acyl-CoA thioesterase [Seongchinamella unica]|uniref:acyl-CoA thioesterase n=1 Tax=Seongchinamella unica TaxID=2547392 RepID=UPI001404D2BC|nr:thioesterase family protein [Seongchinamella unica]